MDIMYDLEQNARQIIKETIIEEAAEFDRSESLDYGQRNRIREAVTGYLSVKMNEEIERIIEEELRELIKDAII